MKPLVIDLFCGMFGWSAGFVAEGWRSIGFDISHEPYHGAVPEHCRLVLQDVLTIHGSQFKDADCIVASPPCQQYSWLAMPWSRSVDEVRPSGDGWEVLNSADAKELREQWEREGPDNRLFDACFRIQREAMEATRKRCADCRPRNEDKFCWTCMGTGSVTKFIPLIVENVRGAQPWVGRSTWNFGSFHLWGDVPALMPINLGRGHVKVPGVQSWSDFGKPGYKATAFNGQAERNLIDEGVKKLHSRGDNQTAGRHRMGLGDANGQTVLGTRENSEGLKIGGDWFSDPNSTCRKHGSRSQARKAASAQIAKIPFALSSHIARVYRPRAEKPMASELVLV